MNLLNLQDIKKDQGALKKAKDTFKKILKENTEKAFVSKNESEKINIGILIASILSIIYFIFSLIKSKFNKSPKRLEQIINLFISTFFLILSHDFIYKINNLPPVFLSTESKRDKLLAKLSINLSIPNLKNFITISILNIFAFYGITTFLKTIIDLVLYSVKMIMYIIVIIIIGFIIIYKNKTD